MFQWKLRDFNEKVSVDANNISGLDAKIASLTTYKTSVSGNSTYTITHNLNDDYPFVQAWNTSNKRQELPSIVESTSANVISISSVTSDGGSVKWYEVPYLAQESIFVETANTTANSELTDNVGTVPYILEVQKVPNRFSVKVNSDNTIDLQSGSGNNNMPDETILPNTKNVGLGLTNSIQRLNQGIDPSNFLKTNTDRYE